MVAKKLRREHKPKKDSQQRSAIRPFWSGTITFGLVSVPVYLYPAARRGGMPLRMLDADGTPLTRRYYCPEHNREVPSEQLVRGFEIEKDRYVTLEDSELKALAPRKSRDIDLTRFVRQEQIPPLFFERAYFLAPSGDSTKAYRLLAEAMEKSRRAGVATFVMRDKEYLVAIFAERGILCAETLRFENELRNPEDVGLPPPVRVKKDEVVELAKLVQRHSRDDLPHEALEDHATRRLHDLVEAKKKSGQDVFEASVPSAEEDIVDEEEVPAGQQADLLEIIRRSLQGRDGKKSPRQTPQAKSPFAQLTKQKLLERAQRRKISGRSKMNRQQLIQALSEKA